MNGENEGTGVGSNGFVYFDCHNCLLGFNDAAGSNVRTRSLDIRHPILINLVSTRPSTS